MKKKMYRRGLVMAMALTLLAPPVFGGEGRNTPAGNSTMESTVQTEVVVGQGQELINAPVTEQSMEFTYAPQDNREITSVGSWPNTNGMSSPIPDIPLNVKLLLNQYNEAPASDVFGALPGTITEKMILTYEEIAREELGDRDYKKMVKTIKKRSIIVRRYDPVTEIKPFPMMPNETLVKEGEGELGDYAKMGRITIRTYKEFLAVKDDLALQACKIGAKYGATHVIPVGEGARRMFDTSGGGFSLLTSFAQIFASAANPYGFNLAPGGSYNSGSNQTLTMPYLQLNFIKVADPNKFGKVELAMTPPQARKAVESKVEIAKNKSGRDLLSCPNPIAQNGEYRLCSANAELDTYFSSSDQQVRDLALVRTRDDLAQAVRDNLKGEKLKVAQRGLASTYWEMSQVSSAKNKAVYIQRSLKWAAAAGEKENFPTLKSYKTELETVVMNLK